MSRRYSDDCISCESHGFPCVRCAEDVFCGEIGPGYYKKNLCVNDNVYPETLHAIQSFCQRNKTDISDVVILKRGENGRFIENKK